MGVNNFGAGARMGQCFLIIVNIWFALLGIALIVVGAVVRTGRVGDNSVIQMLRQTDVGGLNVGDVIVALSVVIIIVGVFTLILALDGGIGACARKKWMLVMYVIVLIILLIIEVALLAVWCRFVYGTNNMFQPQMSQIFQRYNGIQGADDTVSQGLNTLFIVMDCCGVSPVSPFANDFQLLRTNYWNNVGMRGPNTIPYSCCREATLDNYKFGQNLACTVAQQAPLVRPRGCYEAFRQLATDVSTGAIVILVIVMVTELLAVMSAIIMVRAIDREKNNTLDPSNPKMYRGREIPLPDSKPR